MKTLHPLAGIAVAVLIASSARPAAAQASAQDQAVAQSLYDEGKKLLAAGKWADACPKLEESQRLDATPVTEFYLADCYEHAGRTASAWTTFLDLASSAHRAGGAKAAEREKVARNRAAALEPKLTQLIVEVPAAARVAGLVVKRDGEVVRDAQWGAMVAVDPGKHAFEASAPGKVTWTSSQDVMGAGSKVTVRVEALADAAVAEAPVAAVTAVPAAPLAPPPEAPKGSRLKALGLIVGGVGVAGLAMGGIFGAVALSKNSQANSGHCGGSLGGANDCDATGLTLRSDAVGAGNVSTVAFIAGGVFLAGGATLFLIAPSGHVQAAPSVGTNGGGVIVRGDF